MNTQFKAAAIVVDAEAPTSLDDVLAAIGQIYAAILITAAISLAAIGPNGLADAESILPLSDPALMANFTA